MPYIDFKYCKNCQYCESKYKKESAGDCIVQYFECVCEYDGCRINFLYGSFTELFVYPGILKRQVETPRKCPYYAEMCLNSWKNEERKNAIQGNPN